MPISLTTPGRTLAQAFAADREALPTDLNSADLRALDVAVRMRSVFSARMTNLKAAQALKDIVDKLLSGEINEATGRAMMQDVNDALGYSPETGYPTDQAVPPAQPGTQRDLNSEGRVKLQLETQERIAANFGRFTAGNSDAARYQFPAWELVRIYPRRERRDWVQRWRSVGGRLYVGRMIATKDDEVWMALGSQFDDSLDNPFPPFAFGSGMGWREVPREECIALGVIAADEIPQFQDRQLNEDLKFDAAQFSPDLLAAVRGGLEEALAA